MRNAVGALRRLVVHLTANTTPRRRVSRSHAPGGNAVRPLRGHPSLRSIPLEDRSPYPNCVSTGNTTSVPSWHREQAEDGACENTWVFRFEDAAAASAYGLVWKVDGRGGSGPCAHEDRGHETKDRLLSGFRLRTLHGHGSMLVPKPKPGVPGAGSTRSRTLPPSSLRSTLDGSIR